jgi:hypothetical protein
MKSHQEIPEKTYSNLHNKKNKISLEKDYTLKQIPSLIKSNSKKIINDFKEIKNTNNVNNYNNKNIMTFSTRNFYKEFDNDNNNNNFNKIIYPEIKENLISTEKKFENLDNKNISNTKQIQFPVNNSNSKNLNIKDNNNNIDLQNQLVFNNFSYNSISKKNIITK